MKSYLSSLALAALIVVVSIGTAAAEDVRGWETTEVKTLYEAGVLYTRVPVEVEAKTPLGMAQNIADNLAGGTPAGDYYGYWEISDGYFTDYQRDDKDGVVGFQASVTRLKSWIYDGPERPAWSKGWKGRFVYLPAGVDFRTMNLGYLYEEFYDGVNSVEQELYNYGDVKVDVDIFRLDLLHQWRRESAPFGSGNDWYTTLFLDVGGFLAAIRGDVKVKMFSELVASDLPGVRGQSTSFQSDKWKFVPGLTIGPGIALHKGENVAVTLEARGTWYPGGADFDADVARARVFDEELSGEVALNAVFLTK